MELFKTANLEFFYALPEEKKKYSENTITEENIKNIITQ
jgi:hypothetical protein